MDDSSLLVQRVRKMQNYLSIFHNLINSIKNKTTTFKGEDGDKGGGAAQLRDQHAQPAQRPQLLPHQSINQPNQSLHRHHQTGNQSRPQSINHYLDIKNSFVKDNVPNLRRRIGVTVKGCRIFFSFSPRH